jgi:hypothetical protein
MKWYHWLGLGGIAYLLWKSSTKAAASKADAAAPLSQATQESMLAPVPKDAEFYFAYRGWVGWRANEHPVSPSRTQITNALRQLGLTESVDYTISQEKAGAKQVEPLSKNSSTEEWGYWHIQFVRLAPATLRGDLKRLVPPPQRTTLRAVIDSAMNQPGPDLTAWFASLNKQA